MGEKMQFTELDQYLFGQGTHYDIYNQMPDLFLSLEILITGITRRIL